jgi:hypothetical protein
MKEFKNKTRSLASGPKDRMKKLLHVETNSPYTSQNIMNHQRKDGVMGVAGSTHDSR